MFEELKGSTAKEDTAATRGGWKRVNEGRGGGLRMWVKRVSVSAWMESSRGAQLFHCLRREIYL